MPGHEHEVAPLVAETIRVLAAAWRAAVAYPRGHPRQRATLETAHRHLQELTDAKELVLGVDPTGFHVGPATLATPAAERLARALWEREVAVVRIAPGIGADELDRFLMLLGAPAAGEGAPPLWDQLSPATTPHLRVVPVDYSMVHVTDDLASPGDTSEAAGLSLATRIVRALMAGGGRPSPAASPGPAAGDAPGGTGPADPLLSIPRVAELIADAVQRSGRAGDRSPAPGAAPAAGEAALHPGAVAAPPAGGPSLVPRVVAAVEQHLRAAAGHARAIAAGQTAALVLALPEPIREAVLHGALRVLVTDEAGEEPIRAFTSAFAPDEVLTALRALQAQSVVLSRHALLMLRALADTRAPGTPSGAAASASPELQAVLRAELVDLFRVEDVDRFNPEDHQALLDRAGLELPVRPPVARGAPDQLGESGASLADDALARQLALSLLDLAEGHLDQPGLRGILGRVEDVYRALLGRGRIEEAIGIVETLRGLAARPAPPPGAPEALAECLDRLGSVEMLAGLVAAQASESVGAPARRLLELLGGHAVGNLLLVLMEETHRSRRRHAFDVLVAVGPAVVPPARAHLGDRRWYVVRNMIALLRAVGDRSSLPEIRRLAAVGEPQVRVEALRTLLAFGSPEVPALLARAFEDANLKTAEAAVAMAGEHASPEVVELLLGVLRGLDLRGRRRPVRVAALRALGRAGDPVILPRLGRFLRETLLPLASLEERRAAFRALEGFPPAARRPWASRGLASRDDEIRQLCQRLLRGAP